jgi:hypothetical protein
MSTPRKYPELDHEWALRYSRSIAQAKYRGEGWDFTPTDWRAMWDYSGMRPGRGPSYGCMTRIDPKLPWSVENCKIVPRRTHMKKNFYENCLKIPYVEEPYVN